MTYATGRPDGGSTVAVCDGSPPGESLDTVAAVPAAGPSLINPSGAAVALQQHRGAPSARSSAGNITTLSNPLHVLLSRAGTYPAGVSERASSGQYGTTVIGHRGPPARASRASAVTIEQPNGLGEG